MKDKTEVLHKLKLLEKNIGRRPTKRDDNSLYFASRKYFGSWNNLMRKAGHSCKDFQKPSVPKELTEDLFYLLGLISTDGHIQFNLEKEKYKLMIYTSEEKEKQMIIKLFYKLFNYSAAVRERNTPFSSRKNFEIYLCSKRICEFLISLGLPQGNKSSTIRIPNLFNKSGERYFWPYLRGVFDGDGSIITNPSLNFRIYSGSKEFILDIQKEFLKRGFNYSKVYPHRDNVWLLKLNRKEDISKLYSLLYQNAEYFYARKRNKWNKQYV